MQAALPLNRALTPPVNTMTTVLAWLCAVASVIAQRLLVPAALLAWDLLTTEQPERGVATDTSPPLESLTRAQLKELAGVRGNRTKAELIRLVLNGTTAAEYRFPQSTGFQP